MNKKSIYKGVRLACICIDALAILLLVCLVYYNFRLPESYTVTTSEKIHLDPQITMRTSERVIGQSTVADVYFLGTIPVKSVSVSTSERKILTVSGAPFGVRMFTEGAMVVGLSDIYTENGRENPAKLAGLKVGDIILAVNGTKLKASDVLTNAINRSNGKQLELDISRDNTKLKLYIKPVFSTSDNQYRLGVWLRDSSAGIGIMTFVDKNSATFGGLGHPICDADIGDVLPLRSGEIMQTVILGYKKGEKGSPGELRGRFEGKSPLGSIQINSSTGVYGKISDYNYSGKDMPVAYTDEIHAGNATILTTISGNTPKEYSVVIEKVNPNVDGVQNMVIRVTDPELIAETGGIVQGMSGSPIIQDGRLVGAVTHVLVNDPTRGYGVFIENMLKNVDKVHQKNAA